MKNLLLLSSAALAFTAGTAAGQTTKAELARLAREAQNVTITRDDWGIAHVHGHTDADAVFGMIYAQAEDDFNRVETNFINAQGRLAEAEGPDAIWRDLRMKLFINPDTMQKDYASSPAFLKTLMNAWADGLNYYLATHPNVKPRVITHFEPWMALTFSEGSIGGDIEQVNLRELRAFYEAGDRRQGTGDRQDVGDGGQDVGGSGGDEARADEFGYVEPTGSNGFAIAPSNTADHHAILWINPHTSFFFRSELQMSSDEGLDAYGAATWGQFFIYQGFNPGAGWMHTTSNVDDVDEYAETISQRGGKYYYKYGNDERPVIEEHITIPYKTPSGMASRSFVVYRTHHGPIVRQANGKWIAVRLMQEPVKALTQSYTRTKARDFKEFRQTMELHTNSSNNTIFADHEGNIAYFHANFIPRRDPRFDWTKPVDGSNPATEWGPLLSVEQSPFLLNPKNGWLFNTNDAPWTAAGAYSPKKSDYPAYVETGGENPRGIHATRVLSARKDFTNDRVIQAAFDSYLPSFAAMIPTLLRDYDALPQSDPMRTRLAPQIAELRHWDYRWGASSIATSLAVFYGEDLGRRIGADARRAGVGAEDYMVTGPIAPQRLASLAAASDKLMADFGTWRTAWGDINRFQRLDDAIESHFDDAAPSIPVPFTSSRWGSLASFGARQYPNTKKWYGTSGNSFLAAVDFGDSVTARAITAGGESGDPRSKHFNDEAERYASGNLRTVYFYPSQLTGHTERVYHPGQ